MAELYDRWLSALREDPWCPPGRAEAIASSLTNQGLEPPMTTANRITIDMGKVWQITHIPERPLVGFLFVDGCLLGELLWTPTRLKYEPIPQLDGLPTPNADLLRAFHTLMMQTWHLPTEVTIDG